MPSLTTWPQQIITISINIVSRSVPSGHTWKRYTVPAVGVGKREDCLDSPRFCHLCLNKEFLQSKSPPCLFSPPERYSLLRRGAKQLRDLLCLCLSCAPPSPSSLLPPIVHLKQMLGVYCARRKRGDLCMAFICLVKGRDAQEANWISEAPGARNLLLAPFLWLQEAAFLK